MTYMYESLLDEHFQHLCQALLLKSFPRLQCLPVGMPDGGRDAVSAGDQRGIIVFQVKFARDPSSIKDPVAWVKKAIDGEWEKVEKLVARGATEYILLTNVRGSSHLKTGRNDKISAYFKEKFSIPAACWWRDDLDRRLDNNFDLKLRYPSLLSGTDMLRLIWERGESGRKGIENTALRAYIAAQYEQDKTVRFKQAELTASSLFEIFIDVPVTAARRSRKKENDQKSAFHLAAVGRRLAEQHDLRLGRNERHSEETHSSFIRDSDGSIYLERPEQPGHYDRLRIGAADALLDAEFSRRVRLVVLEGAPGQGKSTLTQYIGQVNRSRLLGNDKVDALPGHHSSSPVAVPLRLELRDLAQWLKGQDPWANEGQRVHRKPPSLESALAGQIIHLSGGAGYRIRDLHELLASTPVYLLLDGLDEVADLDDRRRVVDEVSAAITRLEGIAKQLNVLVTSRPTVISGTPTFPEDKFMFLKLSAIHRDLALEYTNRWAEARSLSEKDRKEVRQILADKMNAPHMAELAKNTMQLSILLSLIYLRGASLPDKRTELYDTYVDTFLNRESEKSPIVRKNRRLLVEIHRYLAFYLHANAEGKQTSGRIRVAELRKAISEYLIREGRPPALVEELVIGTVERVVALVSRVEGTYEFEVQPLREYFAARYLYDTASYSPAGRNRTGTKPDRFDAVARNPYWLNVTRFFAGCFSKGELLDLAERVCTLIRAPEFKFGTYGRSLAIAFLQDWVFTQSVTATTQVVSVVFDDFGIRAYGGSGHNSRAEAVDIEEFFALSDEAGGMQLVQLLWDKLKVEAKRTQRSDALCRLLMRHLNSDRCSELWMSEARRRRGDRLAAWFSIGRFLGAFEHISASEVEDIIASTTAARAPRMLSAFARGGGDLEHLRPGNAATALECALTVPRSVSERHRSDASQFLATIAPDRWVNLSRGSIYAAALSLKSASGAKLPGSIFPSLRALVSQVSHLMGETYKSIKPWTDMVTLLESNFGKNWTALELSIISASVIDAQSRGAGASRLFNADHLPTARVRFAKRKYRDSSWWMGQVEQAEDELDRAFWVASLYNWADASVVATALPVVDASIKSLRPDLRTSVAYACERGSSYSDRARRHLPLSADEIVEGKLNLATVALISNRLPSLDARLLDAVAKGIEEPWIATAFLRMATLFWVQGQLPTDEFLQMAEDTHAAGGRHKFYGSKDSPYFRRVKEAAPEILERSNSLPEELLIGAQIAIRRARKPRPVLAIAEDDDWFGRSEAPASHRL